MFTRLALFPLAIVTLLASIGCASRTVYVTRDNEPTPRYAERDRAPQARNDYNYDRAFANPPPVTSRYSNANQFVDQLDPYGRWQQHSRYGLIFIPARNVVGRNFRPYTQGSWAYTSYGWTWNSSLPFGWATGHYGRWFFDSRLGWCWVPGTRWSPAWVTWRSGGGYVGWAPLPPGASYGGNYSVYRTSWVFVETGYLGANNVYSYSVRGPGYNDCYSRTRPYRETVNVRGQPYYRGPDPADVRRNGGRVVHRPLRDSDRGPTARDRNRERDRNSARRGEREGDNRARAPERTGRERDTTERRGEREGDNRARDRNPYDLGERDPVVTSTPKRRPLDLGERDVGVRNDAKDRYDLGERDARVRSDSKNIYDLGERDPRLESEPKPKDRRSGRYDTDRFSPRNPDYLGDGSTDPVRPTVRGSHEDDPRPRYENVRPPEDNPYLNPSRKTPVSRDPRSNPRVNDPRVNDTRVNPRLNNGPRVNNRVKTSPRVNTRPDLTPRVRSGNGGLTRPQPRVTSTPSRVEDPRSTSGSRTKSKTKTRSKSKKSSKKK